jgi:glycosyltransferase involved in cell wall biosynthesis
MQRKDTLTNGELTEQRGGRAIVRAFLAWLEYARDGNWARAAARLGSRLARERRYDVVISSGPPHMAHEAGRRVSVRHGIPLVVDMRDPWSFVQRFVESVASPVWLRLARRYERRVVLQASLVTMNTETSRDAMRSLYPDQAHKVEAIRNGCDDEPLPSPRRDGRFTIRFAGSIYADRDPRSFFRAAALVVRELSLTPAEFGIEFIGDVDRFAGISTQDIAAQEGIGDFVRLRGHVPRDEAQRFLADATMLLSLPQDSDFSIPAKIYEYLRFSAWMLVLGPSEGATSQLLRDTEADVVDAADVAAMARVIRTRYEQFRAGEMPLPAGRDGRFDRSVQARRLLQLLAELPSP